MVATWNSGKKSSQIFLKGPADKKNLAGRPETTCLSVKNTNSWVKLNIVAAYLLETAQKKQNIDKREDFVQRGRLVDEKGWHHVCQADECTLHIYYLC